jgi:hypothetical protein
MRRRTPSQHLTPRVERHSYVDAPFVDRRGRFAYTIGIARKQEIKEKQ